MMDPAFLPFAGILERLVSFRPIEDEAAGVRSYIHTCEIEMPVELDVVRDADGTLKIGSTPPLYNVNTTFTPSFHRVRFVVQTPQQSDGD